MPLWAWLTIAGSLLAAGGALAAWGLFADRSRARRCLRCGYDMAAVPGLVCPECGREAKSESHLVGTRRRWGRIKAGAAAAVLGLAAGAAGYVEEMDGGWWRLAPTSMLLNAIETSDSRGARKALWARITSDDPNETLGIESRLSPRHWQELAELCGRLVGDPSRDMELRSWAQVTLGSIIPEVGLVDPVFESLLRSPHDEVRRLTCSAVHNYYLTHERLSDRWTDDMVATACDPQHPVSAPIAAHILARTSPLALDELRTILTTVRGRPDAATIYTSIAEGTASGVRADEPLEVRLAFLEELATFGPASAAAAKGRGMLKEWGLLPPDAADDNGED